MFADNHAFVNFHARPDKKNSALLQAIERIGRGRSQAVGDERAGGPLRNLALVWNVAIEERVHDDGSARLSEHFRTQADEPAARHAKLQAHAARTMIVHLGHLALARAELFNHRASELLGHVDGEVLDRLHAHAVYHFRYDFGTAGHQLEALAAHHFNQNRELQFATAQHLEAVR